MSSLIRVLYTMSNPLNLVAATLREIVLGLEHGTLTSESLINAYLRTKMLLCLLEPSFANILT